ncbi:MAG TPA: PilZ domain-containing protein [Polyangia bacterium]|nr:PilZ domain-containing protein [Polyangia bacterium]
MNTKRFWASSVDDRRARRRVSANFYAIELAGSGRYLRRVENVSRDGLLLQSPLGDETPGQIVELELPRGAEKEPVRVKTEVVYVTPGGQVGVRRLDSTSPLPVEALGGRETL